MLIMDIHFPVHVVSVECCKLSDVSICESMHSSIISNGCGSFVFVKWNCETLQDIILCTLPLIIIICYNVTYHTINYNKLTGNDGSHIST